MILNLKRDTNTCGQQCQQQQLNVIHRINLPRPLTSKFGWAHLIQYGIIKSVNTGMYAYLPLGLRILNKLTQLVDDEMANIGAQKVLLPALTAASLWKKTERLERNKTELFFIRDRQDKKYILSPTYEEAICDLISSLGHLSPKSLPLQLYQISNKWRDEMKPRLGFLRSREFIMKDLYTFDTTLNDAKITYDKVCKAYDNIFEKIGIKFIKAIGDTGSIGGSMSHEYHYVNNVGEDIVLTCSACQYYINKSICSGSHCPHCKNELIAHTSAEVGHAFLLDTKYSKPLKAQYKEYHTQFPLAMGCFGLGLSRIISTVVEILSTKDELRWPKVLAPYTVCLISPKAGSKEESGTQYIDRIIEILEQLNIDVIFDDRTQLTIGNRLIHARATGYPYIIVIGKSSVQPTPSFEIHDINGSQRTDLSLDAIHSYFNDVRITCNKV